MAILFSQTIVRPARMRRFFCTVSFNYDNGTVRISLPERGHSCVYRLVDLEAACEDVEALAVEIAVYRADRLMRLARLEADPDEFYVSVGIDEVRDGECCGIRAAARRNLRMMPVEMIERLPPPVRGRP